MIYKNKRIIIVDDDVGALKRTERVLRFEGYTDIVLCERAEEIDSVIENQSMLAMILDLMMPGTDGYQILERMHSQRPDVPIIVATALDDLDSVIKCMKLGAFDYVPKTAETSRLLASLKHLATIHRLLDDNKALRDSFYFEKESSFPTSFENIITRDKKMHSLFRYISAISGSDKPILITGESGTGKELFASAVHSCSGRSGEMISVNIAGLDDTMFSDTLFGHKKGAFTGADSDRPGLIEKARGGTLFLDEIGDLHPQSQVKLLRLIEQRLYYPLGADTTRCSDALIIAATNKDLEAASLAGNFRQDLYYRLQTHLVHIPALRDRLEDIPLLVEVFTKRAADKFKKPKLAIPQELYDLLSNHDFPGNVRELESMVYDAVGQAEGRSLSLDSFKTRVFKPSSKRNIQTNSNNSIFSNLTSLPTLKEASDELIKEALKRSGGNQGIAAGLLGISRPALNRRLKQQDVDDI